MQKDKTYAPLFGKKSPRSPNLKLGEAGFDPVYVGICGFLIPPYGECPMAPLLLSLEPDTR